MRELERNLERGKKKKNAIKFLASKGIAWLSLQSGLLVDDIPPFLSISRRMLPSPLSDGTSIDSIPLVNILRFCC